MLTFDEKFMLHRVVMRSLVANSRSKMEEAMKMVDDLQAKMIQEVLALNTEFILNEPYPPLGGSIPK